MSRGRWLAILVLVTGCAAAPAPPVARVAPSPVPGPPPLSALLLGRADSLFAQGDYARALEAYSDFARQYPDDGATARVIATRDALDVLGATREEVIRLNAEVAYLREQAHDTAHDLERLRRELGARAAELGRVRQELGERQAELARLLAEVEQLRADLERLKSVDLRLERRR